jgi:hypothetical protein
VMLERLEKRPRATPTAFSPLIFDGSASASWFCVSPLTLRENALEGIYIGSLGQAERCGAKMDGIGGPRAKQTWVARHDRGPMPPGLLWALVAPSRGSPSQVASYVKILTPKKS